MGLDATQYGPWALVAGASEGTGACFARRLAASRINVVLAARRIEPLDELARELRESAGVEVRTVSVDLTASDMLDRLRATTDDVEIGTLIYNAGVTHEFADFLDQPAANAMRVIHLNVIGQTLTVHHYGGLMKRRRRGGIMLLGSVAGVAGSTKVAAYSGAKGFSHAFAEALWAELKPYGVHVLGYIIGLTKTPNMLRRMGDLSNYPHAISEPDDVAAEGLAQFANGPIQVPSAIVQRIQGLRNPDRAEAVTFMSVATRNLNAERRSG